MFLDNEPHHKLNKRQGKVVQNCTEERKFANNLRPMPTYYTTLRPTIYSRTQIWFQANQ